MSRVPGPMRAWFALVCVGGAVACGGRVAPDGSDDRSDRDSGADPAPRAGTGGDSFDDPPSANTGGSPSLGGTGGIAGGGPLGRPTGGAGGTPGAGGAPSQGGSPSGEVPLVELMHRVCESICSCQGPLPPSQCETDCFQSVAPLRDCLAAREMVECVAGITSDLSPCSAEFSEALSRRCTPFMTRYSQECLAQPPEPPTQGCAVGVTTAPDYCSVEAELCDDGMGYRVECKISSGTDLVCSCWDSVNGITATFTTSSVDPAQEYCGRLAVQACGFPVAL